MDLLLLSTSTVHGSGYLEYARSAIASFFSGVPEVLFIPYARPGGISHAEYAARTRGSFLSMGLELVGIHEAADPAGAVAAAEGVFVGGGNTFVLLRDLYETGVLPVLRDRARTGLPYLGSSAGSNVAGLSIGTSNDMPIVLPPSLDALGLVPFNLNPHYVDPDPASTHMGETRETRIREFHGWNPQPVLGLREGAMLSVAGERATVGGEAGARLFRPEADPVEVAGGTDVSFLLEA